MHDGHPKHGALQVTAQQRVQRQLDWAARTSQVAPRSPDLNSLTTYSGAISRTIFLSLRQNNVEALKEKNNACRSSSFHTKKSGF